MNWKHPTIRSACQTRMICYGWYLWQVYEVIRSLRAKFLHHLSSAGKLFWWNRWWGCNSISQTGWLFWTEFSLAFQYSLPSVELWYVWMVVNISGTVRPKISTEEQRLTNLVLYSNWDKKIIMWYYPMICKMFCYFSTS